MKTCPLCHKSYDDKFELCPRDQTPLEFVSLNTKTFTPQQIIDGRYKLISLLGSGAFSEVWECFDLHKKVTRAIKLLNFMSSDIDEIKDSISRFFREADAASRLGHPNIVEVIFFGKDPKGQAYLVMERLKGISLQEYIESDNCKKKMEHCLKILIEITEGITAAHNAQIIHRDLKPENIYIIPKEDGDTVKLLDFGVAKILHDEKLAEISKDFMFGTPSYMSPEQIKGHSMDERTDIYSLGVIMFELFTGKLPFTGYTAQVLLQHISKPPPNPQSLNSNLDSKLTKIILKAMSKHLDNRYQSMTELGNALKAYLSSIS